MDSMNGISYFCFFSWKCMSLFLHRQSRYLIQTHTTYIETIYMQLNHFVSSVAIWLYSSFLLSGYLVCIMLLVFFILLAFSNMMFVLMEFGLWFIYYFCVLPSLLYVIYVLLFFFSSLTITQYSIFFPKHPFLDFVWFNVGSWILVLFIYIYI